MSVILGIDQGTTGTRACLVDASGRILHMAYAAHRQIQPHAGWVEHDVDEIWVCTTRVIAEVLAQTDTRPAGVAIANQGETVAIWDARTLRPLHHAIVWQDTRTEAAIQQLAADPAASAHVRALTGLRLDSYFSASKLRWLLDHVPGARALADAGLLRAGTLDTWLVQRLTAGAVFATDASTAARTLLCDTQTLAWSEALLEMFAIPHAILPEIRASDAGFGTCTGHGLDGIPILASLVDQPAALLGHGCVERGSAKATFGTGCFVYVNAGSTRPAAMPSTLVTVAWRRAGETCYALDGGVLAVGSAIGWLRELGVLAGDDLLAAIPERTDRDVVCVPALVGLGAPHWDRDARASWLGLSLAASRGDLVGALLEGLACRVAEVVRAVEREAGITIAELSVDGGLARSPALMQLQADLLGRPVLVAAESEATVSGACAMASLALGETSLDELRGRRARSQARYEPQISTDERLARLDRFERAVALTRQWRG